MKYGNYFVLPQTKDDYKAVWDSSDPLFSETTPEWMVDDGENPDDWRLYAVRSCDVLSQEEKGTSTDRWQDGTFFGELETLYVDSLLIIDPSECGGTHHIYVMRDSWDY